MKKKKDKWDMKSPREIPLKENILKDTKKVMGAAFDPQPSRNRVKTYVPINDQDN